jgi:hypothetical protein
VISVVLFELRFAQVAGREAPLARSRDWNGRRESNPLMQIGKLHTTSRTMIATTAYDPKAANNDGVSAIANAAWLSF